MNILFVTWDGPQVTYLEGLFLPIFAGLAERGYSFHVLQFTWGKGERIASTRQACEKAGVSYEAVQIWRRPRAAGSLLSALAGTRKIRSAMRDRHIDLVMARSTLPGLAAMVALRDNSCPLVFDADGLPLDERVDFAGQSPSGLIYRLLRDVEAQVIRRANTVLARTEKAVEILQARGGAGTDEGKFHVVSNGRDAGLFKPADSSASARVRHGLGIGEDAPLLVYAGSMGQQYCIDEMFRLFSMVQAFRPDARLLVLTGSPEAVRPVMDEYPQLGGAVTVRSVTAQEVPQYLGCADLGLALRRRSFSMQAVAPVKLGEYLLCGLPVVATAGIGDTRSITEDAGILLHQMDDDELKQAARWFVESVLPRRESYRASSRAVGLSHFSLDASVASYQRALSRKP